MKFGISTWNFLMTYGKQADLDRAMESIRAAYFGLELWLDWRVCPGVFERKNWDHLKRMCSNHMRLSLHSRLLSFFDPQIIREEIELCRFLEGDLLVVHPRSLGVDIGTLEYSPSIELSESMLERVITIVEYAAENGVCLALENGPFMVLKCIRDRIRAEGLEQNLGICLDTGHANVHRAQDPALLEQFFEEFREDLFHIHISDNHGAVDEHILPGEGTIDWSVVIPRLLNLTLKGEILFELNTAGEPIVTGKSARDFLLQQRVRGE